jgi:small subunit ribosomal protein S18
MVGTTASPTRRARSAPPRRAAAPPCPLCRAKVEWVDYKDLALLRRHMNDRGKIRARHVTGTCARHQGEIAIAIKTARDLVLLPYGSNAEDDPKRRAVKHIDVKHTDVKKHDGESTASSENTALSESTASSEPLEMSGTTGGSHL